MINNEDFYISTSKSIPVKWAAPEVLMFRRFSHKSDVFAFGVLLWEIWSYGTVPFPEFSNQEAKEEILKGTRLKCPPNTPPKVEELMKICWAENPEQRPSFRDIFELLKEILIDDEQTRSHSAEIVITNDIALSELGTEEPEATPKEIANVVLRLRNPSIMYH
jgi:serine/threonine protein kinase